MEQRTDLLMPLVGKAPDYRYAGLFFHEQSGLYLAVFRAYDPSGGRWISRDPIGEEGGVNLYGYSKNDPTNAIDPLGNVSQIVKSVGLSLTFDILAGMLLFFCPECEGGALIIELGGQLLDAAEDYYKGRHDIETNRKMREKVLAQVCKQL
ncbi:RHS repeat domain-containing protein [Acidithiobacillus sulfuriphilus]